jgi:hypothetical protein
VRLFGQFSGHPEDEILAGGRERREGTPKLRRMGVEVWRREVVFNANQGAEPEVAGIRV